MRCVQLGLLVLFFAVLAILLRLGRNPGLTFVLAGAVGALLPQVTQQLLRDFSCRVL